MVFSGRVECALSKFGLMGSARVICRVRFAENMIFCLRLNMVAQVGIEILGVLLEVLLCNRGYVISFCRKMRVME